MAAGGPVADPGLELVLLTAICPHTVFRSMVIPADKSYYVREFVVNRENKLAVTADGLQIAVMAEPDRLIVRKYSRYVRFVDLGLRDFYDKISEKLSWGSQR
jgi:NAD+ kinase